MLSRAWTIFARKRRSSRSSRGKDPALSASATTPDSGIVNPAPRAIHISNPEGLPILFGCSKPYPDPYPYEQFLTIIFVDPKGKTDSLGFNHLLGRETGLYPEFNTADTPDTIYYCGNYRYTVDFFPPHAMSSLSSVMQHICLVLLYDASSRDSWDEVVATYERLRNHCKDRVLPFLTIMIAATDQGKDSESYAEAEAFASQRGYLFIKFSPTTGRGIRDAIGLVVELAYGARDQYTRDEKGSAQRFKRASELHALLESQESLAQA